MTKALSPHMKNALMRMGTFQSPLMPWGNDVWSTDERPDVCHGALPHWHCTIGTVRALEDRGLVQQVDARRAEKKDRRVLTELGLQEARKLLQAQPPKLQPKASALALHDSEAAKASLADLQSDSRLLRELLELVESLSAVVQHHTTYTIKEGKSLQTWCSACGEMLSMESDRLQTIQKKAHQPSCVAEEAMRRQKSLLRKEGIAGY